MPAISKYKQEYCKKILEHFKHGLSFEAFAGEIAVNPETIRQWRFKYPEFKEACATGMEMSRLHWEKIGLSGIMGRIKNFNAAVYIFTMKNRFAWKDAMESSSSIKLTVATKEEKAAKILDFLGVVPEKE